MIYLNPKPNENGAYPNPKCQPFSGCIPIDDQYLQTIIQYNGFVTVAEDGTVTPNTEAWEAWKSAQPDPEPPQPTAEERIAALESAMLAMMMEV